MYGSVERSILALSDVYHKNPLTCKLMTSQTCASMTAPPNSPKCAFGGERVKQRCFVAIFPFGPIVMRIEFLSILVLYCCHVHKYVISC